MVNNKLFLCSVLAVMTSSHAERFPNNECALIVASRQTMDEVRNYISENISDRRYLKVYKASNGWNAISIGMLQPDEVTPVMTKWKTVGRIPQDSFCATGVKFIEEVSLDAEDRENQRTGSENSFSTTYPTETDMSRRINLTTKLTKDDGEPLNVNAGDPMGLGRITGKQMGIVNNVRVSLEPNLLNRNSKVVVKIRDKLLIKAVMTANVFGLPIQQRDDEVKTSINTVTLTKSNNWSAKIKSRYSVTAGIDINGLGILKGGRKLKGLEESAEVLSVQVK